MTSPVQPAATLTLTLSEWAGIATVLQRQLNRGARMPEGVDWPWVVRAIREKIPAPDARVWTAAWLRDPATGRYRAGFTATTARPLSAAAPPVLVLTRTAVEGLVAAANDHGTERVLRINDVGWLHAVVPGLSREDTIATMYRVPPTGTGQVYHIDFTLDGCAWFAVDPADVDTVHV